MDELRSWTKPKTVFFKGGGEMNRNLCKFFLYSQCNNKRNWNWKEIETFLFSSKFYLQVTKKHKTRNPGVYSLIGWYHWKDLSETRIFIEFWKKSILETIIIWYFLCRCMYVCVFFISFFECFFFFLRYHFSSVLSPTAHLWKIFLPLLFHMTYFLKKGKMEMLTLLCHLQL